MSTPTPGRVWTSPPPVEPHTYGLLNVADITERSGQWQIGGVEYPSNRCATGGYVVGSCPVPAGAVQHAEVTVTPVPGSGQGYEVRAASTTAPNTLRFTAGPNLPGLLTLTATRPLPPRAQVRADPCDPTGLMVSLFVDNASPHRTITLHPGEVEDVALEDGTWNITAPGCEPVRVTLPLPAPDPQAVLGSCAAVAVNVTVTSSASSEFPVGFTLGPFTGALEPGESASRYLIAGSYALDVFAPGTQARSALTIPGEPVTVVLERTPTSHDKHCTYGMEIVQSPPPFTVYACYECNAVGSDEPQAAALERLGYVENREVEEFFSAQVLAGANRFPAGQDPLGLDLALGVLENDAARHYGGQPTLHAPRWTQPFFSHHRLVRELGPHLRTWLRSRVAFGGGYLTNPFDPDQAGYATFWLFATGTVRAHRTAPFVNETFRRRDNTRLAIAERTYLLDHDCYLAAVQVVVPVQGGGA